ncbi:MAG: alpha/beta hydrolase [Candidatus Thorarchaeota archaeon]|jgi:alpha-beta hydrolase superfamily lysophospholipase
MKFEESQYIGYDGMRMHMSIWKPDDDKPRALLIAIHGLGSHGYTLRNIGEYLADRGIAVFAPDMRGFGHYTGLKGHVMNANEYIEDIQNLVMQVKDYYLNKITFLFGHSLGAQHVIRYVVTYPKLIDGIMLSCPAVSKQLPIPMYTRAAGTILSILNVKRYFSNTLDPTQSSHDPEAVKEHMNDPLRFDQVTPRFGISHLKAMKEAFHSAHKIIMPVLLQQAGNDMMIIPEKSKEFFDSISSADKTWMLYEGFYHSLHAELDKDRVLGDMDAWLERRLPS